MKAPEKCDVCCECKNTGQVEVQNQGQFNTKAATLMLPCNGPMGHWIHYRRYGEKRTPRYDPETMALVGEPPIIFQKQMF